MLAGVTIPLRIRALVLLMVYQSTMHIGTTVGLNVALPQMVEDFDADLGLVAWMQVAYGVGLIGTALPLGLLISHFDARKVIVVSQVFELVVCLLIAVTTNIYVVIVLRVLQASMRTLPWLSLQMLSIGQFPAERRGRVLGITTFSVGVSMLLSAPLVGFVTDQWDWRWLFVGTGVAMGLIGVLSHFWLRYPQEERPPVRQRLAGFDVYGSLFLMVGAIGMIVALQMVIRVSLVWGIALGVLALGLLLLSIRVELRHPAPVVQLRLFRIRGVFLGATQAVLMGWVTGAFLLILPFLFISGYGWSAAYAGGIFFFVSAARPGASFAAGWLSDRFGSAAIIVPASVVIVLSQLFIASLDGVPALGLIIGGVVVVGFAQAMSQTSNLRQMYASVPQGSLRLAPGLNIVLMSIGNTTAQAVVASILAVATVGATGTVAPDVIDTAGRVLIATTSVFAVGMVLTQIAPALIGRRSGAKAERDDVEAGV